MESNLQPNDEQKKRPRLVQRRTGLRGLSIGAARAPARTIRKNTEDDLKERDPEIPYVKAEAACRDLVCCLMEREDRMNEELLEKMVDLQYRMDDLETDFSDMKARTPADFGGTPP
jgi:hypothetical protein